MADRLVLFFPKVAHTGLPYESYLPQLDPGQATFYPLISTIHPVHSSLKTHDFRDSLRITPFISVFPRRLSNKNVSLFYEYGVFFHHVTGAFARVSTSVCENTLRHPNLHSFLNHFLHFCKYINTPCTRFELQVRIHGSV